MNRARKSTLALLGMIMIPSVIIASQTKGVWPAMLLIALACGSHQAWATMLFTVPSDLFPSGAAGTVTGIGGFVAGMVSIVTAELTGQILNLHPGFYTPMFLGAACLYPISLAVLHALTPKMKTADLSRFQPSVSSAQLTTSGRASVS